MLPTKGANSSWTGIALHTAQLCFATHSGHPETSGPLSTRRSTTYRRMTGWGHTTVAITLNRYSHVTETMQCEVAQVMGAIVFSAGDLDDEGSG